MEIKIIKQGNEIEDICISYGLCKILDDNDIEYTLKDNKSIYSIYAEDFDINDLEYYDFDVEDAWNISTSLNRSEKQNNINKLNEFFNNNLEKVFNYYIYNIEEKLKKETAIGIGNVYYNLGIRGSKRATSLNVNPINKWVAFLGWLYGSSYIKTDQVEINALIKPNNIEEIYKPFNYAYVDKETGDIKILTKISKETNVNIMARIYLESLLKNNLLQEKCENIIYIKGMLGGKKPLADKTEYVKIKQLSNDLLDDLIKKITYTNVNDDCKRATSLFVLNMDIYINFRNIIKEYSKNNCYLNLEFKEEILKMYNEKIQNIYNNETINKLGYGLNRLLRDNKGFEIQNKLYTVANERHMFNVIRMIIDKYNRTYKKSILNDEELKELTTIIIDKDTSKITSDALLSLSKVFIKVNK